MNKQPHEYWLLLPLIIGVSGCMHPGSGESESREPRLRESPPPISYPLMLKSANIEGEVVVDVLIDPAGQADWHRSHVLTTTHELFTIAVRKGMTSATWIPASRRGAPVEGVWRDTADFVLFSGADSALRCRPAASRRRTICAERTTIPSLSIPSSVSVTVETVPPRAAADERGRLRWHDSLAAGRLRWARAAPLGYRIDTTTARYWSALDRPERAVVEVRSGRMTGVRRSAPTNKRTGERWRTWTVDSLFAVAEAAVSDETRMVTAFELDPVHGFPRLLESDVPGTSDSWLYHEVRSFVPVRSTPHRSDR